MNVKEILEISSLAGEILLESGAEIFRVEDTIERICSNYGYNCEALVTLTGMYVSCKDNEGIYHTLVKRIKKRNIDLHKIELVNSFSRQLEENKKDYNTCKEELLKIKNLNSFHNKLEMLASGIITFNFSLFFGGTIKDAIVAGLLGMLIYLFRLKIDERGFYDFLKNFLSGFLVGFLSIIVQFFINDISLSNIISGTIILLTPGLSLTNGLRDILHGDYISGLARFLEATLIAVAIGAGVSLSLLLII